MAAALADLTLLESGKVREIYEAGPGELLLVASDRVSTYDVVHPTPIPGKGLVLTGLSDFWFRRTEDIVANDVVSVTDVPDEARGRTMRVRRLEMLPVECVVRGYLSGSGWRDYRATGSISGIELPAGLRESDALPEPIFTPATKAQEGHDETISFAAATELLDGDAALAQRVRDVSHALYARAAAHAREQGIILADTKFEFGLDERGELVLGDELCTSDSSRYWPADAYSPGGPQPSFDKQFVRDWATSTGWDRQPPAPALPDEIVAATRDKYVEIYERLTGEPFAAWLERTGAPSLAEAGDH